MWKSRKKWLWSTGGLAALALGLGTATVGAQQDEQVEGQRPQQQERADPQAMDESKRSGQMPSEQAGEAARNHKVGKRSVQTFETTAGAIAAHPQLFYGNVVSVSAEVEDKLSPQAFTLDEDTIGAGPDVVVVAPRAIRGLEEDENVRVVGYLQPLLIAEFDRDYDWFDSNWFNGTMGAEIDVRQRPVLIAASITTEEGEELLNMDQRSDTEGSQQQRDGASRP